MLPNGPIFSDFGPESDFFEQNGPKLVRITSKSEYTVIWYVQIEISTEKVTFVWKSDPELVLIWKYLSRLGY